MLEIGGGMFGWCTFMKVTLRKKGLSDSAARFPEHLVDPKETELDAEERRIANFVDFIGEGRGSRSQALGKPQVETERRVEGLREELKEPRRGSASY